ncbi:MAG: peroxidase [Planctomycetes bacterium]|nr:peroxidase [Planctomycetota bacterium]
MWIRTIAPEEAHGLVKKIYAAAVRRAGKVFHIVRAMSLTPPVQESALQLYQRIMFGSSALSRRQREMLAVVVSRANDCHY